MKTQEKGPKTAKRNPTIKYDQDYYEMLMRDYGYDPIKFRRINFSLGNLSEEELRLRWLCHHEGNVFAKKFDMGDKSMVATGFGMSGTPHIGTVSQILRSITLQKQGVPVSMVIGDLDAYNNKETPISRTLELAERFRDFIVNLGFDDKPPSILRTQNDDLEVLRTSYIIGRFMDDDMFDQAEEDLYGSYIKPSDSSLRMLYRRKLSLNLMTADFINLYFKEGIRNVMVMLGVDEHGFVRLARKTISSMISSHEFDDFEMTIAGLYTPLIIGFNNHPKMSKSVSGSGITVDMSPDEIRDLIMNGEGGYDRPENNVVYQMISAASYMSPDEIREAYNACSKGGTEWNRVKSTYTDILIDICSKWSDYDDRSTKSYI